MTLLRGRGTGLEVVLSSGDADALLGELGRRLSERPDFYRGTPATALFGTRATSAEEVARLKRVLEEAGVTLCALSGGPQVAPIAAELGLDYAPSASASDGELERRRALRPRRSAALSDSARSLVADFAGARADIAARRKRGESSVRHLEHAQPAAPTPAPAASVTPATLYHVGTLRGGQSLQQLGNIVVVGDVNPGAELIASGDVVVFGALRGVAHAGAQGDAAARVYALELAATQLRIATCIAAEAAREARGPVRAEVAEVRDGRIVIMPYDRLDRFAGEGVTTR